MHAVVLTVDEVKQALRNAIAHAHLRVLNSEPTEEELDNFIYWLKNDIEGWLDERAHSFVKDKIGTDLQSQASSLEQLPEKELSHYIEMLSSDLELENTIIEKYDQFLTMVSKTIVSRDSAQYLLTADGGIQKNPSKCVPAQHLVSLQEALKKIMQEEKTHSEEINKIKEKFVNLKENL